MKANQAEFPIATMCRVLGVSTSGYYAWAKRGPSARQRADAALSERLRRFHGLSRRTYGAPRLHRDVFDDGWRVGQKRIARLMRQAGIRGVSRRKWICTTQRAERPRPAPDLVERDFSAERPDELYVADITYIPTWASFLFLAVVLDVCSRRVVGWAMASHLRTELMVDALNMALRQRRPQNVIHHSDQGTQYTSIEFGQRCRQAGVRPSMGSAGDCFDNAMCESFFATLECELIDRSTFHTRDEARLAVFDYIEGFYNPHRRHSSIGNVSPMNFEKALNETTHISSR